jgi:hypothetical protein
VEGEGKGRRGEGRRKKERNRERTRESKTYFLKFSKSRKSEIVLEVSLLFIKYFITILPISCIH